MNPGLDCARLSAMLGRESGEEIKDSSQSARRLEGGAPGGGRAAMKTADVAENVSW